MENQSFSKILICAALFTLIFLFMFRIGGSTGIILGYAALDIALHDTSYVEGHFHLILSLGAVIAIFSGIMYFANNFQDKRMDVFVIWA